MTVRALLAALTLFIVAIPPAAAQTVQTNAVQTWPNLREGDLVIKDFAFASGEILPELKLHYRTLGTEKRNAAGEIINGVMLLAWNERQRGGLGGALARQRAVRRRPAARCVEVFHHLAGRHRAWRIVEAERWPARQVSALPLPRHRDGRAPAGDRAPQGAA